MSLIFNIILVILLLFIVFEIFFTMNFTSIYVEGPSMLPTLNGAAKTVGETQPGGDYIFVDVHASPDYGDIVVVRAWNAGDGEHNIIKRVVAFGGDTVKIERGVLFLKKEGEEEFTEVPESYVSPDYCNPALPKNNFKEHTVEKDHMFLLGDNRDDSSDSRGDIYGDFPLDTLVGVVPWWSMKYKGFITSLYSFFDFTLGFKKLKH